MYKNIKKGQHGLKLIKRFDEDIFGRLAQIDKPTKILDSLYETYLSSVKYKRLVNKRRLFKDKKN